MDKNSNIEKMKILHTADWHLGQSLYGFDRLDEQRRFLGQLCEVVAEERPDAMVVAGDVFDISMPSAAAQRVYAEGLPTVLAAHLAVLGCDLTGHRRMQNDSLGTVDYVELPTLGTAYDYIALGHIHHPQTLRGSDGRAAYSGSPIAVGFDERYQHGVVIVDLEKGKPVEARAIGINDPRPLVTLPSQPAAFDDALAAAREFPADRKAYIRLNVLLDKPLPSDYNEQVVKALEGKACRYCTINVTDRRRSARANALPDVTPEQLRQMTVGEVAARFFAAKGIPEKESADYLAMISGIEKEIEEENAL